MHPHCLRAGPIAKVGGLADVLLGLCRELSWKGHDVDIILPKYDCMDSNDVRDLSIENPDLLSYYNGEWHHNIVWVGWVENLKVYFIEPHHPAFFLTVDASMDVKMISSGTSTFPALPGIHVQKTTPSRYYPFT